MKLELTPDDKRRLLNAYLHLTPWPDAVDALDAAGIAPSESDHGARSSGRIWPTGGTTRRFVLGETGVPYDWEYGDQAGKS
jgi:hypothetical protein